MNYKRILSNKSTRLFILNLFSWIPDKFMIKLQYRIKTNRKLNLSNPQRFSEKLQFYKLYYHNPLMHKCVDKYEVRSFIESKKLSHILNEVYGVYNSPSEIDFDSLPNSFVLKTTLGGGGQNVLICKDKNHLDINFVKKTLGKWINEYPKKSFGREWAYDNGVNRIIAEKLIESDSLIDYKFFCFNGKVSHIYTISDRDFGVSAKLGIYDVEFNKINAYRCDELRQTNVINKPKNFKLMVEYAECISKDFPHARVDFYNIDGHIIFGEITFYDGSGYISYDPDSFDFELGKLFELEVYK